MQHQCASGLALACTGGRVAQAAGEVAVLVQLGHELAAALDNALRSAGFDGWGVKVDHPKAKGDERRIYASDPNPHLLNRQPVPCVAVVDRRPLHQDLRFRGF